MRVCSTNVLVVSVLVVARVGSTQENAPILLESIRSSTARFAVQRAMRDAAQRLECPECGKVLSDFRDAGGHTIQGRLDVLSGRPPRDISHGSPFVRRSIIGARIRPDWRSRALEHPRCSFAVLSSGGNIKRIPAIPRRS
jgi:hypothetical protein